MSGTFTSCLVELLALQCLLDINIVTFNCTIRKHIVQDEYCVLHVRPGDPPGSNITKEGASVYIKMDIFATIPAHRTISHYETSPEKAETRLAAGGLTIWVIQHLCYLLDVFTITLLIAMGVKQKGED
jgi:hypothetical protein